MISYDQRDIIEYHSQIFCKKLKIISDRLEFLKLKVLISSPSVYPFYFDPSIDK